MYRRATCSCRSDPHFQVRSDYDFTVVHKPLDCEPSLGNLHPTGANTLLHLGWAKALPGGLNNLMLHSFPPRLRHGDTVALLAALVKCSVTVS